MVFRHGYLFSWSISGIVGYGHTENPSLLEKELAEFTKEPKFVGIRNIIPLEEPGWLSKPGVEEGMKILEKYGLAYDLLVRTVPTFSNQWTTVRSILFRSKRKTFQMRYELSKTTRTIDLLSTTLRNQMQRLAKHPTGSRVWRLWRNLTMFTANYQVSEIAQKDRRMIFISLVVRLPSCPPMWLEISKVLYGNTDQQFDQLYVGGTTVTEIAPHCVEVAVHEWYDNRRIEYSQFQYFSKGNPLHLQGIGFVNSESTDLALDRHLYKALCLRPITVPAARDEIRIIKSSLLPLRLYSGMVTEADLKSWKAEDFATHVQHVLHQFGVDRVMFGSDWPVCKMANANLGDVYELLDKLLIDHAQHKKKIFQTNAITFYKLKVLWLRSHCYIMTIRSIPPKHYTTNFHWK